MKVNYWRGSNGRFPVWDAIRETEVPWSSKIVKTLEKVQEYGWLLLGSKFLERVEDTSLYEVRIQFNKRRYRIYGPIIDDTFWACHMILKKSPRPPLNDVRLAENRAKQITQPNINQT